MYKCNHFYGICILYMFNRKKNQNRELNYILNSNSFFLDTQHVIGMIGLQAWNSEKQKCCWKQCRDSMASKPGDSDGGSMTPSEPSDGDDRSDRDSDYESDNEEE